MKEYESASHKDLEELYQLQKIAFESEAEMIGSRNIPALLESYEEFERDFDNWIVVIKRDSQGKIMASARYFKKNDTIEVGRLMVAPSFRNQGLAFSIMKNVEDHSRGSKFELFTCTRSWINIRLYEKLGYRIFKEGIDDNELPLAYMEKCINENT